MMRRIHSRMSRDWFNGRVKRLRNPIYSGSPTRFSCPSRFPRLGEHGQDPTFAKADLPEALTLAGKVHGFFALSTVLSAFIVTPVAML